MDDLIKAAVETIEMNKQALIFLPSRASAEKTAEELSAFTKEQLPELEKGILQAVTTPTKQCRRLSQCVRKGIAFHHSGLTSEQREIVEDNFREGRIKVICCTPTLCLSGDTLIWQPNGETRVEKFGSGNLFGLSLKNELQVMKAKETHKIINYLKLVQITSVSNYSIKLTPNHQILVKRDNKKCLIAASECQVKDRIATVGRLRINDIIKPQISHFVLENKLGIENRELTEDDFYFIGSMLGDGYSGAETKENKIIYKTSPNFTSGDEESLIKMTDIIKHYNSNYKRYSRPGSISLRFSKYKWFREFLCRSGVEVGKNKFIHPSLMRAPLYLVKNLIRGLFDTDGSVQAGRNVGFNNISLQLIRDLQKLLLRFGIVCKIRKRPGKEMFIIRKFYHVKDIYELLITQEKSIHLFYQLMGFNLKRKQDDLNKLISVISHVLYNECKHCHYRIYADIFGGRSKEQREWGERKKRVIELLGKKGELGSREIKNQIGFLPRHPKGNRLNHHYELIAKKRVGSRNNTEWLWSLKPIGIWVYREILTKDRKMPEFLQLDECPVCKTKLDRVLRKQWRNSDFEGDIFWDFVRSVKEIEVEENVYDVVLPDKPLSKHMFVANGFIIHNSAGVSTPAFRVLIKSLKRYDERRGMDWIPVLEYLQMAGRAGRPEYEKFGEALLFAKDDAEKEDLYERYICGLPEDIYSKLAVEPVLRTYLLSLISSGIIRDHKTMMEFFSKTFWAFQFEDLPQLEKIMHKMLGLLEEWKFVQIEWNEGTEKEIKKSTEKKNNSGGFVSASKLYNKNELKNEKLRPTMLGKRISELYLDPLTAKHLLDCLDNWSVEKKPFSLLQMVAHTLEMRPLLNIKSKDKETIFEELNKRIDLLLEDEPHVFDLEYPEFFNSIKTSLFLEAWIEEKDEEFLLETFEIRPGEIRVKVDKADWLLYAAEELAKIEHKNEAVREIAKLRVRVQNGVREELLPVLQLKGVGRVRARKLFAHGVKNLGDIKKMDVASLRQILGKAIGEDVKKQLGEEVEVVSKGKRKGQTSLEKY